MKNVGKNYDEYGNISLQSTKPEMIIELQKRMASFIHTIY